MPPERESPGFAANSAPGSITPSPGRSIALAGFGNSTPISGPPAPGKLCRFLGSGGRDLGGTIPPDLSRAKVRAYPLEGTTHGDPAPALPPRTFFAKPCSAKSVARLAKSPGIVPGPAPSPFFSYTGAFLGTAHALRDVRRAAQFSARSIPPPRGGRNRLNGNARAGRIGNRTARSSPIRFRRAPPRRMGRRRCHRRQFRLVAPALVRTGSSRAKLRIIPLAYDAPRLPPSAHFQSPRLRVLWLGQVILRKGIQYFCEAARLLLDEPVDFVVAGPIGISAEARRLRSGQCPLHRSRFSLPGRRPLWRRTTSSSCRPCPTGLASPSWKPWLTACP